MVVEVVDGVVVDFCTRSFLLIGDQGSSKVVDCKLKDKGKEFINVLAAIKNCFPENRIVYADVALYEKTNPKRTSK